MGNFALISKSISATEKRIADYYRSYLGKEPRVADAGNFLLLYCNKGFLNESHFYSDKNGFICFSGTPIYSGLPTITETAKTIYQNLCDGKLDPQKIRGNYCFVFFSKKHGLRIGHDGINVASLFTNQNYSVISNSFITTALATNEQLEYNTNALMELCLLGQISGNETIFSSITKIYHNTSKNDLPFTWATSPVIKREIEPLPTAEKEVNRQLSVLKDFFNDVTPFFNHYGTNLGLSDGHDSRLLAGFFKRQINNLSLYTFWRKKETKEIQISRELAKQLEKPLRMIEGKDIADKMENEVEENFREAFFLLDGQPRLHNYFFDDFNTVSFLRKLSTENSISVNGVGGEAYRNNRHFQFGKVMPGTFFKKYIIEETIPGILKGDKLVRLIDYLQRKFDGELGSVNLKADNGFYYRKQVHFYFNEYQNNAYRLNRSNGENKYIMQVAPFLDPQIVIAAYNSIPFHGISYWFQQEMLRKNDPELAGITSGYGYNFNRGEPLTEKIKYLVKSITPSGWIALKKQKKLHDESGLKMMEKFPIVKAYAERVKSLNLGININKLFLHPERWPVMLSLGFALIEIEKLKNKDIAYNER